MKAPNTKAPAAMPTIKYFAIKEINKIIDSATLSVMNKFKTKIKNLPSEVFK